MLDGELRPVSDAKSQTRWFNYNGDLITFDDDDTRTAKATWGVSAPSALVHHSVLTRMRARLRRASAAFVFSTSCRVR